MPAMSTPHQPTAISADATKPEQKRNAQQERPKDDGGAPTDYDLPLLRNIRRSVWD